jgi:uncharacterized protein (TIGR00251 family)
VPGTPQPPDAAGVRITERDGGVRLRVRVIPRARRSAVDGVSGDALKLRVAAPPVDGAANDAVVEFVAQLFDVPRRAVAIAAGHTSRNKLVDIRGITVPDASARLTAALTNAAP